MRRFDPTTEVTTAVILVIAVVHFFVVDIPYWYVIALGVVVGSVVYDDIVFAVRRSRRRRRKVPPNALRVAVAVPFTPKMWMRAVEGALDVRGRTIVADVISKKDLSAKHYDVMIVYERWLDELGAVGTTPKWLVVPTRKTVESGEIDMLKRRMQWKLGTDADIEVTPTIMEVSSALALSPDAPPAAALKLTAILLLVALLTVVGLVAYIVYRYA